MGYPPPSIIKVAEFCRDFRRYYHLRPVEFNDRCMAQIMGYVTADLWTIARVCPARLERFFLCGNECNHKSKIKEQKMSEELSDLSPQMRGMYEEIYAEIRREEEVKEGGEE